MRRPIYIALALACEGTRDILGLWAGEHGDGQGANVLDAGPVGDHKAGAAGTA